MSTVTALSFRDTVLQATVRGTEHVTLTETSRARWADWLPEQLWMWPAIENAAVQTRMHKLIKHTVTTLPRDGDPAGMALLHELRRAGQRAAVLRISARLLRSASADAEDLAACCFLVAAIRHNDALAAIEFAALAERRALLVDGEVDGRDLPPELNTAARLATHASAGQGRAGPPIQLSFPGWHYPYSYPRCSR